MFSKYSLIKSTKKKEYSLTFNYNAEVVNELLDKIEKEVNSQAEDAKITIEFGNVKINRRKNGTKLKRDELKEIIINNINSGLTQELVQIEAPVEVTKPTIDKAQLEKMNKKILALALIFYFQRK